MTCNFGMVLNYTVAFSLSQKSGISKGKKQVFQKHYELKHKASIPQKITKFEAETPKQAKFRHSGVSATVGDHVTKDFRTYWGTTRGIAWELSLYEWVAKRHFEKWLTQKILMLQSKTVMKRRIAIEKPSTAQFHETLRRIWFFRTH